MKFNLVRISKKTKERTKANFGEILGYILPSRSKKFNIAGVIVKNINVVNKKLAYPFVIPLVNNRFQTLITYLAELLVTDDETGEAYKIALNEVEKFRLEIKVKYRHLLKRKELEFMAKNLEKFQTEAKRRYIMIQSAPQMNETIGKSR